MMKNAESLGIPATFNAATWFVDRNVAEGRGSKVAIECGDDRVTYEDLLRNVNRAGHALRTRCGVRPEERVLLLVLDGPAGAIEDVEAGLPSVVAVAKQREEKLPAVR